MTDDLGTRFACGSAPRWSTEVTPCQPMSAEMLHKAVLSMLEQPMRPPIYDKKFFDRYGILIPL